MERVREEIAKWLWGQEAGFTWPDDAVDNYETELAKKTYGKKAAQILSIDGIRVEAKDQSLPPIKEWWTNRVWIDAYSIAQHDMLNEGFIKVEPKGGKE